MIQVRSFFRLNLSKITSR